MIGWDRQQLSRLMNDVVALSVDVGIPHMRAVVPLKRGTILGSQLELLILSNVLCISNIDEKKSPEVYEDIRQDSRESAME